MWMFVAIGAAGALSVDVIESGPFTSLEQAMLPATVPSERRARIFGTYNAVAALAGSFGALLAGGPSLLRQALGTATPDQRYFLLFVPAGLAGAAIAASLSPAVEASRDSAGAPLRRSRAKVARLAALFATDSFGGGFVIQSFVAYWLRSRHGASLGTLGVIFFAVGLFQAMSYLAAPRIAERIGLLNTLVFTHLPSNVFLALIPLAPSLSLAVAFLLGRQVLSQMDVPTRQAYVVTLVDPEERTAAAAYTNSARYLTRPLGPALSGAAQQVTAGLPFFLAGGIKAIYDVALYVWFRHVSLEDGSA
jgi:predicted MFS family arabinose efflux permease